MIIKASLILATYKFFVAVFWGQVVSGLTSFTDGTVIQYLLVAVNHQPQKKGTKFPITANCHFHMGKLLCHKYVTYLTVT